MNDKDFIRPTIFRHLGDVCCAVSTKNGGVSPGSMGMNLSFKVEDTDENVRENRRRMFSALEISLDNVAFTEQVHSTVVINIDTPGIHGRCDALITTKKGLYCAVSIADCVPVFLVDAKNSAIAAIHSGWRGSDGGIVEKSVNEMTRFFRSDPANILAYLGPSAGVCCYEIGEDVARRFENVFVKRIGSKGFLDLRSVITSQLLQSGLQERNIETSQYCTICDAELFHSYRRDKEKSGRMLGVIGIRP